MEWVKLPRPWQLESANQDCMDISWSSTKFLKEEMNALVFGSDLITVGSLRHLVKCSAISHLEVVTPAKSKKKSGLNYNIMLILTANTKHCPMDQPPFSFVTDTRSRITVCRQTLTLNSQTGPSRTRWTAATAASGGTSGSWYLSGTWCRSG